MQGIFRKENTDKVLKYGIYRHLPTYEKIIRNLVSFYNKVIELFQNAKKNLSVAVNMTMVYSYYEAGRMIVEEEQDGKERASYGKYILRELSERLTEKLGRGYSSVSYTHLTLPTT